MELLAQDKQIEPLVYTMAECQHLGIPEPKAIELTTAIVAFPRIPQKLWPITRSDSNPGQHLHITQLPFDIATYKHTGYALTY